MQQMAGPAREARNRGSARLPEACREGWGREEMVGRREKRKEEERGCAVSPLSRVNGSRKANTGAVEIQQLYCRCVGPFEWMDFLLHPLPRITPAHIYTHTHTHTHTQLSLRMRPYICEREYWLWKY